MDLNCKLIEKAFTDKDGLSRNYFVLQFTLSDGSTLDVTLKGDKARILKLSNSQVDKDFWGK